MNSYGRAKCKGLIELELKERKKVIAKITLPYNQVGLNSKLVG